MIRLWLAGTAFLLAQGTAWRALFWFLYRRPEQTLTDALPAFRLGARLDLTVACYVFSVPLLLWIFTPLFPAVRTFLEKAVKPYLIVMMGLVAYVSLVDVGYYSFYQDRLNVLVFGFIEDDTWALVKTMWKNYPVVPMVLLLAALVALPWWALRRRPPAIRASWWAMPFFLLNGLGARGSLGIFLLSEMDTHVSPDAFVNLTAYNPVHALSRAIQNKRASHVKWNANLERFGYADDPARAWAECFGVDRARVPADPRALLRRTTAPNPWAARTRPHVVVVVMESLGGYWMRYRQEPFDLAGGLKPALDGTSLLTFLPATGATIGSLSSLMAGVPHRPSSDFLTEGIDLATPMRTAPARVFKNAGYDTRFIYAGNPGWRDIAKYAATQGFETVEGDVEIERALGRKLERHDWGVYDADAFAHVEDLLRAATRPQFILLMTTANHPPYSLPSGAAPPELRIPAEVQARFVGDAAVARARLVNFRFSNDRLGDFLNALDRDGLAEKTVLAATGDHAFWIVGFDESEVLNKDGVPLILKLPKAVRRPFPPGTYGAHSDIWPTLYELSLDARPYDSASVNLLDPKAPRFAFNAGNLVVGPAGGVMVANRAEGDSAFAWDGERLKPAPATAAHAAMAARDRCLMSLLDDLFFRERRDIR